MGRSERRNLRENVHEFSQYCRVHDLGILNMDNYGRCYPLSTSVQPDNHRSIILTIFQTLPPLFHFIKTRQTALRWNLHKISVYPRYSHLPLCSGRLGYYLRGEGRGGGDLHQVINQWSCTSRKLLGRSYPGPGHRGPWYVQSSFLGTGAVCSLVLIPLVYPSYHLIS